MSHSTLIMAQAQANAAQAGPSGGQRAPSHQDPEEPRLNDDETASQDEDYDQENAQEESKVHYRLQVEQNPSRGRTCGFGDADRRALSAPLILRLRAFSRLDDPASELDSSEIETTFLVCCADLWSADATREENLVHHPSYSQRPLSTTQAVPLPSRPTTMDSLAPSSMTSASRSHIVDRPCSASVSPSARHIRPFTAPRSSQQAPSKSIESNSHGLLPTPGYFPPVRQPEGRSSVPGGLPMPFPVGSPTSGTFAFQAPQASPFGPPSEAAAHLSTSTPPLQSPVINFFSKASVPSSSQRPSTMMTARPATAASAIVESEAVSTDAAHPYSALACVKNLVGALTTGGHRLLAPGDTREGIFFVFHDLSVRTEGTFTIRLRLVSIGSLLTGTSTGPNHILAEVFTAPFEVMSAKRFPGMLDPTPLSQAFAKQGLRIPTRKGANRKRRRTLGGEANAEEVAGEADDAEDNST